MIAQMTENPFVGTNPLGTPEEIEAAMRQARAEVSASIAGSESDHLKRRRRAIVALTRKASALGIDVPQVDHLQDRHFEELSLRVLEGEAAAISTSAGRELLAALQGTTQEQR